MKIILKTIIPPTGFFLVKTSLRLPIVALPSSILINAAQHQGYATYQEIAQVIGLPTSGNYMGVQIGELLGAISANEKKHKRPMLSAIAIGTDGNKSVQWNH